MSFHQFRNNSNPKSTDSSNFDKDTTSTNNSSESSSKNNSNNNSSSENNKTPPPQQEEKNRSETPEDLNNSNSNNSSRPRFFNNNSNKPSPASLRDRIREFRERSPFNSDSFIEDLRKELDKDRKMFFDSEPSDFGFSSSPRASGFPGFDGFSRPTTSSRFEDLAQRHPMFAQHMRRQPWGEDPFGNPLHGEFRHPRDRHNSGGGGSTCSSAASGSSSDGVMGGERVIPIHVIDNNNSQKQNSQQQQQQQQNPQQNHLNSGENNLQHNPQQQQKKYASQRNTTEIPIQRKDNTDGSGGGPSGSGGGENDRGQRAQSAPPTSSDKPQPPDSNNGPHCQPPNINQYGVNSSKSPQPPQSPPPGSAGIRNIPIFVEGRSSPIYAAPPPPPTQQQQEGGQGGSPNQFEFPNQNNQQHPPPPKKPTIKGPKEKVQIVYEDVQALEKQVDEFKGTGSKKDKDFIFLDEMLTRNLIKLDDIDTEGKEDVRQARRDCIKLIQKCISKLEQKASQPTPENTCMEIALIGETAVEKMEIGTPRDGSVSPSAVGKEVAIVEGNSKDSLANADSTPDPVNTKEKSKSPKEKKKGLVKKLVKSVEEKAKKAVNAVGGGNGGGGNNSNEEASKMDTSSDQNSSSSSK